MRICTLLGVLGGLFLVGWLVLAFVLWKKEKEASRRHKEKLRLCGTEEIAARAWNWGHLNRYAETPPVQEFRALLEQHRYGEILERWRVLSLGLFAVGEEPGAARPEFHEGDTHRALRDYVEVLHERQQQGEEAR